MSESAETPGHGRGFARCGKEVRMPYRFNSVDILVGVGLCAIVFGAMILVVATSGAFLVSGSQSAAIDEALPQPEQPWFRRPWGGPLLSGRYFNSVRTRSRHQR